MKKGRLFLTAIIGLSPFSLGASSEGVRFSSVSGDPLIAGKDQRLSFVVSHAGSAYSCFEFVFAIEEGGQELFRTEKTFFKVSDGVDKIKFTIPGSVLGKGAKLTFSAKLEHRSDSFLYSSYVCYDSRTLKQVPQETGKVHRPSSEALSYSMGTLYYPHFGLEEGRYVFSNIQRKRKVNARRLRLEEITFEPIHVHGKEITQEKIGELRIFTRLDFWKIGVRKEKKYLALPLGYSLRRGVYSLRLFSPYSFSRETGEMREYQIGNDTESTRDLILPSWAKEEEPLRLEIALSGFTEGEETIVFEKEAYYEGTDEKSYRIRWEER